MIQSNPVNQQLEICIKELEEKYCMKKEKLRVMAQENKMLVQETAVHKAKSAELSS